MITVRWIKPFQGVKAFGMTVVLVAADRRTTATLVMIPAINVHP